MPRIALIALALGGALAAQQRAEHRIGVEAGQARPHDAAVRIHQRADGAVADHAEVEAGVGGWAEAVHGPRHAVSTIALRSQSRRAWGWAQRCSAALGPSPTLMPTLKKVLARFDHIKRLIVVADRGLLSLDNIDELGKIKLPNLPFHFSGCDTTIHQVAPVTRPPCGER